MKKELYEQIYAKQFSFGKNWKNFLKKLNSKKIRIAEKSLKELIKNDMKGKTFLDIGCGSGLFSLAAIRAGAKKVVSVDIDDTSITCAEYLREKYKISHEKWKIIKGSVLDKRFIKKLGRYDIVYSWGVLHHTGDMKKAIENSMILVEDKGSFCIAIYNKIENNFPYGSSKLWTKIKKRYSKSGKINRTLMKMIYVTYYFSGLIANLKNPISYVREYENSSARGMDFWSDVEDWLGGYPYEAASDKEIIGFFQKRKFKLANSKLTKALGCNEYLFERV